jgi:hypothetical protein
MLTGAGLAVTGPICDIGQNVLQYSFETGGSNSPSYFHIFCFIAFLEEGFIRNKIIIYKFSAVNYISTVL